MTTANQGQQTGGAKAVQTVEDISNVIGTLVPTVAAIGGAVRLILSAVKPSDAQKAQPYVDASAQLKSALGELASAISGFDAAKAAAQGGTLDAGKPSSVSAGQTTGPLGSAVKPLEPGSGHSEG